MTDGLEEAAFLVHSPHRVEILQALQEGPQTRGELTGRTGVSRVTMGRSLGEMETRRWVGRADGQYHLLPLGAVVSDAAESFLGTLAAQGRLRDVVGFVAPAELGFDLTRLADATVIEASRHDASAVTRRYLDLLDETATLRVLKDTVDVAVARVISDRIDAGDLAATVVYSPGAIETTRKIPEARELMCRDLANGKEAFCYDGELTHHLAVLDDVALLFLLDDHGIRGLIETADPVVYEWATERFQTVRADARPLDAAAFQVGNST